MARSRKVNRTDAVPRTPPLRRLFIAPGATDEPVATPAAAEPVAPEPAAAAATPAPRPRRAQRPRARLSHVVGATVIEEDGGHYVETTAIYTDNSRRTRRTVTDTHVVAAWLGYAEDNRLPDAPENVFLEKSVSVLKAIDGTVFSLKETMQTIQTARNVAAWIMAVPLPVHMLASEVVTLGAILCYICCLILLLTLTVTRALLEQHVINNTNRLHATLTQLELLHRAIYPSGNTPQIFSISNYLWPLSSRWSDFDLPPYP